MGRSTSWDCRPPRPPLRATTMPQPGASVASAGAAMPGRPPSSPEAGTMPLSASSIATALSFSGPRQQTEASRAQLGAPRLNDPHARRLSANGRSGYGVTLLKMTPAKDEPGPGIELDDGRDLTRPPSAKSEAAPGAAPLEVAA